MIKKETIETLRSFNRFYSVNMNLLSDNSFYKDYSLSESRVIFEIHFYPYCIQNDLVKNLKIDKSYLSRMLNKLTKKGLITKTSSNTDKRAFALSLTEKGEQEYERLVQLSNDRLQEKIKDFSEEDCEKLTSSLKEVMEILNK